MKPKIIVRRKTVQAIELDLDITEMLELIRQIQSNYN